MQSSDMLWSTLCSGVLVIFDPAPDNVSNLSRL